MAAADLAGVTLEGEHLLTGGSVHTFTVLSQLA